MRIEYPHSHSKEKVYEIFNSYFDTLTQRKLQQEAIESAEKVWNPTKDIMDITVYIRGSKATGQVILEQNQVVIESKLPILLLPFTSFIKQEIIKKLEDLL